jgi:hypothetical protein
VHVVEFDLRDPAPKGLGVDPEWLRHPTQRPLATLHGSRCDAAVNEAVRTLPGTLSNIRLSADPVSHRARKAAEWGRLGRAFAV